jgi:pimeloyl-ACP methyl ester carboxylesterase
MAKWLDRVATNVGGALDQVVLKGLNFRFQSRRAPAQAPHAPDHDPRRDRRALLVEATDFYQQCGDFFVEPSLPRVVEERRGALDGGEIVDLKWPSGFEPRWPALREDYQSFAPNRDAYARLYRHSEPRTTLICLHGYRGGQFWVEERAFVARWLYSVGLNVALFILPFHGPRGGDQAPVWPSVNVGRTNEGFAQAVYELRALIRWLGGPVAVMGMSLGGYTASLLATVEEGLKFAAPMIPVASFPDLLWLHGEGRAERARAEREGITLPMLRAAMAVHTPLERAPKLPGERMLVISAEGDRIAPPEHAQRLARHFAAEELRFAGGHVLQRGRGDAFRTLVRRLAALGLLPPR